MAESADCKPRIGAATTLPVDESLAVNGSTERDWLRHIVRDEIKAMLREELDAILRGHLGGRVQPDSRIVSPALDQVGGDDGRHRKPATAAREDGGLGTVHHAAAFLGVSTSWVYHRAAAGTIPCVRVGHNLRFDMASLRAWARGERGGGRVIPLK